MIKKKLIKERNNRNNKKPLIKINLWVSDLHYHFHLHWIMIQFSHLHSQLFHHNHLNQLFQSLIKIITFNILNYYQMYLRVHHLEVIHLKIQLHHLLHQDLNPLHHFHHNNFNLHPFHHHILLLHLPVTHSLVIGININTLLFRKMFYHLRNLLQIQIQTWARSELPMHQRNLLKFLQNLCEIILFVNKYNLYPS